MCAFVSKQEVGEEIFLTFGKLSCSRQRWIAAVFDHTLARSDIVASLRSRVLTSVVSVGRGVTMIVGGTLCDTISSSVESFDCHKRLTHPLAPLNVARGQHGACVVGDAVFVCGGHDGRIYLSSCEIFQSSASRWDILPNMNGNRGCPAVVSLPDGRVFAIGGDNETYAVLSSVEGCRLPIDQKNLSPMINLGSPQSPFWRSYAPMRFPRLGHSAALFQGKVIVAGGYDGLEYSSSVEIFTTPSTLCDQGQWILLSSELKEPRCGFSLVVSSNTIYAFGTWTFPSKSVERFTAEEELLSAIPPSGSSKLDIIESGDWVLLSTLCIIEWIEHAVCMPTTARLFEK